MTEQEIITCLKENKNKGVSFGFLPKEVRMWCESNISKLIIYTYRNEWQMIHIYRDTVFPNDTVSLPDDYKVVKQEPAGKWEELGIDPDTETFNDGIKEYHWTDWSGPIQDNWKHGVNGYTTFGGWQYGGSPCWYMSPQIWFSDLDGLYGVDINYKNNSKAEPAIPKKIRFWREIK